MTPRVQLKERCQQGDRAGGVLTDVLEHHDLLGDGAEESLGNSLNAGDHLQEARVLLVEGVPGMRNRHKSTTRPLEKPHGRRGGGFSCCSGPSRHSGLRRPHHLKSSPERPLYEMREGADVVAGSAEEACRTGKARVVRECLNPPPWDQCVPRAPCAARFL